MNDIYQQRRHNKNLLMVHLIFATKYRQKLLQGMIRDNTKQILYETCAGHHWYIKRMETDKDHVHILLQYNPEDSITRITSVLKQQSTWWLWKRHGAFLKKHYRKERTFWSDGYFAASIGTVSQAVIERYIDNQG